MSLWQKILNWWKAPKRAAISLGNIWAVIQSLYRRGSDVPKYIEEQVEQRKRLSRPECKQTNVCICGCAWDELIWADKSCEGNCYAPMLSKKEWNKLKRNE